MRGKVFYCASNDCQLVAKIKAYERGEDARKKTRSQTKKVSQAVHTSTTHRQHILQMWLQPNSGQSWPISHIFRSYTHLPMPKLQKNNFTSTKKAISKPWKAVLMNFTLPDSIDPRYLMLDQTAIEKEAFDLLTALVALRKTRYCQLKPEQTLVFQQSQLQMGLVAKF